MMTKKSIAAAVAAGAVAVGAIGVAIAITPASAEPTAPTTASTASSTSTVQTVGQTSVRGKARGATVVTFTEAALVALGPLQPVATRPAAFGLEASGSKVQGAFPIVGNAKGGIINHVGGLVLRNDDNILTLSNYRIDTTQGMLTANAFVNGSKLGRLDFLAVQPTATSAGCDVSANLTLAEPSAKALSALFDAPDLAGAAIGTACIGLR